MTIRPGPAHAGEEVLPLRPVTPDEHSRFISEGHVTLDGLWSSDFAMVLAGEARARLAKARRPSGRPRPPVVVGRAPSSQATGTEAPLLADLHLALVGPARALTGRMLVPAYAVFNYYEVEDGVWLHRDTEDCVLTLLTTVLGEVGPLYLHPELAGMSPERLEVLDSDSGWDRMSGLPVEYPRCGVLAHRGDLIPHHRPGSTVDEPSAVAALHYRSLF